MKIRLLWHYCAEGMSLMVGVPDYERYVAHMKMQHPEHRPLSREAFIKNRMEARYGGGKSGKCPC
jgi:uncharacterized short protein YbdD (DUF466 family)